MATSAIRPAAVAATYPAGHDAQAEVIKLWGSGEEPATIAAVTGTTVEAVEPILLAVLFDFS